MNNDEIIHAYTRAQAIEDGVLVDISTLATERGFRVPVAVTSELYYRYLVPSEDAKDMGQTLDGRIYDMLTVFYHEIRKNGSGDEMRIKVSFLMGEKHITTPIFRCVIDGGDDGKPVITIMLKDQD